MKESIAPFIIHLSLNSSPVAVMSYSIDKLR